jgi:hypothetical protein
MESINEDKAMTLKIPLRICILILSGAITLGARCFEPSSSAVSGSELQAEQTPKPATGQAKSTSDSPPPTAPFSSIAIPVRDYPRVASSGRCAPRYRNGTQGSCIADKPCRGYGIRNDENAVLCMCYLTHGGCDAKSRCDDRAHACVADTIQKNRVE